MSASHRIPVLVASLLALLALSAAAPAPPGVDFPGRGAAADPTGRFLVKWRPQTFATPHELVLTDLRDQTSVVIWEFRGSVRVLWAPGGRHVAVTDFAEGGAADVLVFRTSDPRSPFRVSAIAARAKGPLEGRLAGSTIEAVAWRSESTLVLSARRGGDPEAAGSGTLLEYKIGGSLKEVTP
jgi:hypothetical protein